jgi:hypothetical protein
MSGIMNMFVATKTTIATAVDAFFNSVTLLLNTSSTNGAQNKTFLDSSSSPISLTTNGNPAQGTFTPFSQTGWSNYFGSSNYLTTPSSSAFNLSSGDWTIEGWFWLGSNSGDTRLFTVVNSSTDMYGAIVRSGTIRFGQLGVGEAAFGTINLNTWNHIAFSKTSTSTITCYINGTSTGTTTSYTLPNANCTVYIAASPANYALATTDGYISNFRIVKGTAVYTSAFTPPTSPLTAITNTSLLTCQSNRFIDNSTNAFAITTSGTPSVQAFSPFLPTAAYDAAVVGGSGYFVSNSDYLALTGNSVNVGSSDFSLEAWIYVADRSSTYYIFGGQSDRATLSGSSYNFHLTNSNGYLSAELYIGSGNANFVSSSAPPLNAWSHVVLARTGGTASMFLNGIQVATNTGLGTGAVNNGSTTFLPAIGSNATGNATTFTGYISNLRFIIGSGGYNATSSTITVPTALVTNSANTKLLANFTNAGIFDSAAKNDLQTVGNAQVSTTQAKWGTTSMAFDGTGDYIVNPSSALVSAWGSGDFTVEGWYYSNNLTNTPPLWMNSTSNSDGMSGCYVYATGSVAFGKIGVNEITSATGVWSNSQWNHLAVVRSGATVYIYVNGVSVASGAASTYVETTTVKPITLGRNYQTASIYYNGYIDDFRVTKGYARYPSGTTFTPPAAAFPLQ